MSNLETARAMIAAYNAQDADAYVAFMTGAACEANYRGEVLREGREETRSGLAAIFAKWPENRAEITDTWQVGETVFLREQVARGPASDGSDAVAPFEVVSIYSFEGDLCSRVEFAR